MAADQLGALIPQSNSFAINFRFRFFPIFLEFDKLSPVSYLANKFIDLYFRQLTNS